MTENKWTSSWDEQHDLLIKLASDGLSATKIGKQLGRSRHAVVGRCWRKGIILAGSPFASDGGKAARRVQANNYNRVAKAKREVTKPKPSKKEKPPLLVAPITSGVDILALEPHMCKWPINNGENLHWRYCGVATSGTYCAFHGSIATQPGSPAKALDNFQVA